MVIVEIYVDDIIFGSDSDQLSQKFADSMQNEFEMSILGEMNIFLGIQITQYYKGIFISQTKYINEMLKTFQMQDSKPVGTPMVTGCKLSQTDNFENVEHKMYKSMIGSILYVTTTRPDVMHAICQLARFQDSPKDSHLLAVKKIFIYLKGITEYGFLYP